MKKTTFALLIAISQLGLASCDDGTIYPESATSPTGKVVKLEGTLMGLENWASTYHIAIAGFVNAEDEYAELSKQISASDIQNGKTTVVLAGIKDEITEVRLCALDRLRRHIVTFAKINVTSATDTVRMSLGVQDIGMFNAIQQTLFNTTCANCHGAANQAAAGLYLTEGDSYAALVGQPSTKVEGENIVEPADAGKSVLYRALSSDITASWHYNHQSEVTSTDILLLINNWINNGAKKQ